MSDKPMLGRRELLTYAAFGSAIAATSGVAQSPAAQGSPLPTPQTTSKYSMNKSINPGAFPYPDKMSLRQCLQLAKDAGFDGIELNYDLDSELSPKSDTKQFSEIRKMAEDIGIAISGVCSFLFWPYPLTSNDPVERARGLELAGKMTRAAHPYQHFPEALIYQTADSLDRMLGLK